LGHKVLPHWAKLLWTNTCTEEKRKKGKEEREVEEEKEKIVRRGERGGTSRTICPGCPPPLPLFFFVGSPKLTMPQEERRGVKTGNLE